MEIEQALEDSDKDENTESLQVLSEINPYVHPEI